jgi:hypothetical protein
MIHEGESPVPSYPCKWPTCTAYVTERGYCPEHADKAQSRHAVYDRHVRNPEAKSFYNSAGWQRARKAKLSETPWCEWDGCSRFAEHVHHEIPVLESEAQRLDQSNLRSYCAACHAKVEAEVKAKGK